MFSLEFGPDWYFPGMDAVAICENLDKNCWDGCNKTQGQCDWCGQGIVYILEKWAQILFSFSESVWTGLSAVRTE